MVRLERSLRHTMVLTGLSVVCALLAGCGSTQSSEPRVIQLPEAARADTVDYAIGPGDVLQIFVWRHDDLSTSVTVRPDGMISTPLVEDLVAGGKTPTQLARDVETRLSDFVKGPTATVIVQSFVGESAQQIKVVGQATQPRALQFRSGMRLLDVMINVGGLSEFAAGNRAKIVRRKSAAEYLEIPVRIDDLLNNGDMSQNLGLVPGDVLIIPESRF